MNIISPLFQHYLDARNRMAHSDIPLVKQIHQYICQNNGKQLRPTLALLSACCCGLPLDAAPSHPLFFAAAAIETLHISSLVHDDVIDQSLVRRGSDTVNKLWNNKTAVLMGDFYLAQVMKTINLIDNKLLTRAVNDTVIVMSEGELLQQQYSRNFQTDEHIYLNIISRKTAALISLCCQTGAILVDADTATQLSLAQFGKELGIAFQIRDDIIDFLPTTITGKPQGNDIREHKCTLPIILALKDLKTKEKLLPIIDKNNIGQSDLDAAISILNDSGYIDLAKNEIFKHLELAHNHLHKLPDNSYRHAMSDIANSLKEI